MMEQQEPGWKRNGRSGPLDWWLACKEHGYAYESSCLSCGIAEDHNVEFHDKLARERAPSAGQTLPAETSENVK